jgi:hypothetical protein
MLLGMDRTQLPRQAERISPITREPSMKYEVRISPEALQQMMYLSLESYVLFESKRGHRGKEIYGHLWGYTKIRRDYCHIYIDNLSISIASKGSNNSVEPSLRSFDLHNNFFAKWTPQLGLIGDFHTHPYDDLATVKRIKGWRFSDGDFAHLQDADHLWDAASNNPIMVVVTICKLSRVYSTMHTRVSPNIVSFDVADYRIWVNVAGGCLDAEGNRRVLKDKNSVMWLECFPEAFNDASERFRVREG